MIVTGLESTSHNRLNARQRRPMHALVNGPTEAIQNSTFALAASFSIWEAPPRANSVISQTGTPQDCPKTECANPCKSGEIKNRFAVAPASARVTPSPHEGLLE